MVKRLSSKTVQTAYDVAAYGAKGDGTTDDTAAIQAALDAANAAGGGIVFIPEATYIVDPNPGLQVYSNTVLSGAGAGAVLKLKASSTNNDNIVKVESRSNVTLENFTVDGNRTNQAGTPGSYTYTQYGVYLGGTDNSLVRNVIVRDTTGVGIHVYDGDNVTVEACISTGNNYHGYELEQTRGCHLISSTGSTNLLHGVLVSPGEVSGTGAIGNSVTGCTFDSNENYGIATNAANADISAWLNEGNIFTGNTITNNSLYGVNFYKQDAHVFNGNYVAGNGYFGLYVFSSSSNTIMGNTFVNNSQAGNGSYDEILVEGNSSGHASTDNAIVNNTILMSGATKARYGINEATSNDGPNIITDNNIPDAGTSGTINSLCATDTLTTPPGVFQIYGTQAIQGANAGIDGAFSNVMRLYNNLPSGATQIVTPNGNVDFYVGGVNVATFNDTALDMQSHRVVNVTDPSSAQHAATKAYVDSGTKTLTNTRITKRTGTATSSATPTINTDNVDFYSLTAQAVDITSMSTNLSGTPTEGQTLWIAITGTASRAITWGTSFEASTVALPTATSGTSRLDVGFVYNSTSSKWRCVASA